MKQIFTSILVVILVVSIASLGIGCKEAEEVAEEAEEAAEEVAEEVAEEAEEVAEEAGGQPVEELIIGVQGDISGLDVQASRGIPGQSMLQLSYDGLVELSQGGEIMPALAEDWDISDDGLEYTFYLKKGVKFHNGREFVADDVKFSFERYVMPDVGFPFVDDFSIIKDIEVIDDYTVKCILKEVYNPFLAGIATGQRGIVAKEGYSDDEVPKFIEPIGTGPYKFVDWDPDNNYKIEAFEDYWGGTPTVKNITFQIIPDETVRVTALKTGDVDIILSPPMDDLVAELENPSSEDFVLDVIPGSESLVWGIAMDTTKPPFDDVRVRQALYHTIVPEDIIATVYKGIGEVTNDLYPEGHIWKNDIERPEHDIEKAKELLEEAGYGEGFDVLMFASETHALNKISEVIQAQLAEIGINAEIDVLEWSAWPQAGRDWNPHHLALMGTNTYTDPDKRYHLIFHSEGMSNWFAGWWNNEEADALLDEAKTIQDVEERKELYRQFLEILRDDAGFIWTHVVPLTYGYRSELEGVSFNFKGDFNYGITGGIPFVTKSE
jgi:peptide/nickel transport system substrate-binding protein